MRSLPDLIAHYRAVLPLNYYAARYEDLIADQEGEVRKLLDFIGEPFDPATLDFHQNAAPARTASYAQVTEKLYTRSVYRHRNYFKHLEPVIPILAPQSSGLGTILRGEQGRIGFTTSSSDKGDSGGHDASASGTMRSVLDFKASRVIAATRSRIPISAL